MGNFNHLPTEILLDIITRLPTESILDCKLVCNEWRNLVSHHPSFTQLHLARVHHFGELSFLAFVEGKHFYYFQYNENNEENPNKSIRRMDLRSPFSSYSKVIGSFNGLVCLYGYRDHTACICNPVTREYVMIPRFDRDFDDMCIHYSTGFGYLPLTDEYKVVELFKFGRELDITEVAVYTFGSGIGWRNLGRFKVKSRSPYDNHGVYVKGALHWVDRSGGTVVVFDLTEEKFRENYSPPRSPANSAWNEYTLWVFGGFLYCSIRYYCRTRARTCSDVWLLKRKNDILLEPLCWSKEFRFPKEVPLAFTKSRCVIGFYDNSYLGIYDPVASTLKLLVDFGAPSQIFAHGNTLVSMKEYKSTGEEDIKVLESAEILEDRKPYFFVKAASKIRSLYIVLNWHGSYFKLLCRRRINKLIWKSQSGLGS